MYVGVICFVFPCSPTSTDYIYTTRLMLHQQIYNETLAKSRLKIGRPLLFIYGYQS